MVSGKGRVLLICLVAVFMTSFLGCYVIEHTVGKGCPFGSRQFTARQWYILWGLVPLNDIDSAWYVPPDVKDYTIRTWWSPLDIIINFLTGQISILSRTVEVHY